MDTFSVKLGNVGNSITSSFSVRGLPPLVIPAAKRGFVDVVVSSVPDSSTLNVRLLSSKYTIEWIHREMARASKRTLLNPANDQLAAVPLGSDGLWYRAIVRERVTPRDVKVYLVDYGSTEVVDFRKIYQIPDAVSNLPAQSFPIHNHSGGSIIIGMRRSDLERVVGAKMTLRLMSADSTSFGGSEFNVFSKMNGDLVPLENAVAGNVELDRSKLILPNRRARNHIPQQVGVQPDPLNPYNNDINSDERFNYNDKTLPHPASSTVKALTEASGDSDSSVWVIVIITVVALIVVTSITVFLCIRKRINQVNVVEAPEESSMDDSDVSGRESGGHSLRALPPLEIPTIGYGNVPQWVNSTLVVPESRKLREVESSSVHPGTPWTHGPDSDEEISSTVELGDSNKENQPPPPPEPIELPSRALASIAGIMALAAIQIENAKSCRTQTQTISCEQTQKSRTSGNSARKTPSRSQRNYRARQRRNDSDSIAMDRTQTYTPDERSDGKTSSGSRSLQSVRAFELTTSNSNTNTRNTPRLAAGVDPDFSSDGETTYDSRIHTYMRVGKDRIAGDASRFSTTFNKTDLINASDFEMPHDSFMDDLINGAALKASSINYSAYDRRTPNRRSKYTKTRSFELMTDGELNSLPASVSQCSYMNEYGDVSIATPNWEMETKEESRMASESEGIQFTQEETVPPGNGYASPPSAVCSRDSFHSVASHRKAQNVNLVPVMRI